MSRRRWYTLDAETDPFQYNRHPVPFAWGVYDGTRPPEERFRSWWNAHDDFAEWLQEQDAIFYAHNGGKFDFYFLRDYLGGKVTIIGNRMVSVQCGKAELRDSWSLCPIPLSAYAKDVIEYAKFEEEVRETHQAEILDYLAGDCRYLYNLLAAFHAENPGFPLTLPGAGIRALGRIQGLKIPRGSERFDADFRGYYYGGRCQAFETGVRECPLEIVDINSAYPCAMREPHWWGGSFTASAELPSNAPQLSRSLLTIRAVSRGALPIREASGRLWYPTDDEERTYHATGHEIAAGIDTGTLEIRDILECRTPLETIEFSEFVDYYWEKKEAAERAGDEAGRHVAKIMLNGVYGKFAQNPRDFRDFRFLEEGERWEDWVRDECIMWEFGATFILGVPTAHQRYYNVATAASITGSVRAKLWRAICASERVVYCDTDSLIATDARVEIGDELGQWKREARVRRVAIGGRKLYAAELEPGTYAEKKFPGGVKLASKGCKLDFKEIVRVAQGEVVEWFSQAPTFSPRLGQYFVTRKIRSTGE